MRSPSPRNESDDPRSRIVAKAADLVAAKGFGAVSVAEIAGGVGMSKQALLYHFKTKERLKDALLDRLLEHANASFVGLMAMIRGPDDSRFEQALEAVQRYFDAEPAAARVLLRFILDDDADAIARIREGARPWFHVLVDDLREGQRSGRIRSEIDPEAAVAQIGMLVLTNFALLPVHGWSDDSPAAWRKRRLAELLRTIGAMLFTDAPIRRRASTRGRPQAK